MINLEYNDETIQIKRKIVTNALLQESKNIKSSKIEQINELDLQLLYEYYDKIFFNNWFKDNFKGIILYNFSKKMTKNAGITKCPKNISQIKSDTVRITICIGIDFFFNYYQIEGSNTVCRIKVNNSLEALQITLEHELLHALEFLIHHSSDCSGNRFKDTAKKLFGHTQSHLLLPTNRMIAEKNFGILVGDNVGFMFKKKQFTGFVCSIAKRATIMVPSQDGNFIDTNGNRFMKYMVPIQCLEKPEKTQEPDCI